SHLPAEPYRFAHPGYVREVLDRLGRARLPGIHARLGLACGQWRDIPEEPHPLPARRYALKHRLFHLRRGRQWEAFANVLAEADFVAMASAVSGFAAVYGEVAAAAG